jgi:hypothetical protein
MSTGPPPEQELSGAAAPQPQQPDQESHEGQRPLQGAGLPPAGEEIHPRLARLEMLLETLLTQKAQAVPVQTVPIPAAHVTTYGTDLPPVSERIPHSLPIPLVDYKDPYSTLLRWESWHQQVTDPFYKNVCGTHAAIATLLQCKINRNAISSGPVPLQRFEKAVLSDLLLGHRPTPRRDDELWHSFTDLFRKTLDVTSAQEEKHLFGRLFRTMRQPGEPIYSFALEFKLEAASYNQVSRTALIEQNCVHFMIHALNLTGYPLLDLRQKLIDLEDRGAGLSDILLAISKFPELSALTKTEKLISSQTMTKATSSRTFITNMPGPVCDALASELEDDKAPGHFVGDHYNSDAVLPSFKADKKALLFPESRNLKDPLHVPNEARGRNRQRSDFMARDRVIRDQIHQRLGSDCSRCFRPPSACSGPLANNKPSPCASLLGTNYIPPGWSHALKSLLMWLTADGPSQKQMVSAFYARNGRGFGEFNGLVLADFARLPSKTSGSSYVAKRRCSAVTRRSTSPGLEVTPRAALLRRCLSILPDSGNSVVLAGLCWWRDYAVLLREAGLLTGIQKMASADEMSFGDGPAEKPLFLLLQVPLWYRYKTNGAQLVFTNVRIVANEVGLLDGRHNMAALKYTLKLCAYAGRTSFALGSRKLRIADTGSHFMVRLAKPRPFGESEKGLAVFKQDDSGKLYSAVVSAVAHSQCPTFGCELSSYTDDFPELIADGAATSFSLDDYRYGGASVRLWANAPIALSGPCVSESSRSAPGMSNLNGESSSKRIGALSERLALPSNVSKQENDDGPEHEPASDDGALRSQEPLVKIGDLPRLHRQFGHPSASQLLHLLRTGSESQAPVSQEIRAAVAGLDCDFCARRARRRAPVRPHVSIPRTTGPGQDLHLDIGNLVHPSRGPFSALLSTDKFSFYVSGAVMPGPGTARNTIEAFLMTTPAAYSRVTYDLGTNFRNTDFKRVLERLGSEAWCVPADAHWPSATEKSIELVRLEFDALTHEFPDLSVTATLQVAIGRLNSRSLWAHDVTRATIHFGRDITRPALGEQLFAICPDWLSPCMADIEAFLDATDAKRLQHAQHTARVRLQAALREWTTRPDPLQLQNGDRFFVLEIWPRKHDRRFQGTCCVPGTTSSTGPRFPKGAHHNGSCFTLYSAPTCLGWGGSCG